MGMGLSEFSRLKNLKMFAGMSQEKLTGSQFFDKVIYSFGNDSLRQIVLSKPTPCETAARQSRELIRHARKVLGKGGRFEVMGIGKGREWMPMARQKLQKDFQAE